MRDMPFSRLALGMGLPLCLLLSLGCLALALTGCSSYPAATPTFSAMAMARINTDLYGVDARRKAITEAEMRAREKLMTEVMDMRLQDGRVVQDVAILDPFMRSVIDDSIRGANVSDRTISDEGIVTVTMQLDLERILKMLNDYPLQLAEGESAGAGQPVMADAPTSPVTATATVPVN